MKKVILLILIFSPGFSFAQNTNDEKGKFWIDQETRNVYKTSEIDSLSKYFSIRIIKDSVVEKTTIYKIFQKLALLILKSRKMNGKAELLAKGLLILTLKA